MELVYVKLHGQKVNLTLNGVKMAEYINEEPCEFIYNVTTVEKVIDGDTIDAVIDLSLIHI